MPHVFISYAKKETHALAVALADHLASIRGLTAWMDRALKPGQYWTNEIMTQIDKCNYFVVLLSPDVNRPITPKQDRSYVLNELDYVKQFEDKKPVLPVVVIKTMRPVQVAGLQFIDVTATPTDPTRIVEHICEHFGLPFVPRPSSESPVPKRAPSMAEKVEAERLCEQGWAKYEARNYEGALADFSAALRRNPSSTLAFWRRGQARFEMEDYAGVIADLDVVLRASPKDVLALSTRGEAKLQLADYSGAIADFGAVLRKEPGNVFALGSRGQARMSLGNYLGAVVDLEAAVAIEPDLDWARNLLREAQRKLGLVTTPSQ